MDENCDGCIWNYDGSLCVKWQDGNCPCGRCVVKPMCQDPCDTWGLWYTIEHAKKQRKDGWI
ncbi:MAG: hypothetical protein GOV02_02875 [Candidatus Aenigmarchaeota archaeon]|nr:hypothetical protein [Candidatus Aenigmarchaeota archaeon]